MKPRFPGAWSTGSVICAALASVWLSPATVCAQDQPPRRLIIALDAVPFQVAAELTDPSLGDQALFRDLKGPVPLVLVTTLN